MNKVLSCGIISLFVTSCASTTDSLYLLHGPDAAMNFMKGDGKIIQEANGNQSFRFTLPFENSYLLNNSDSDFRANLLAQWLGEKKACPNGYTIKSQKKIKEFRVEVIEGECK